MMLSSRNFGRLVRAQRNEVQSHEPMRFHPVQPRWLAPLELLDAVAQLVPLRLAHPTDDDPNRRIARFSQSRWREEGRAA